MASSAVQLPGHTPVAEAAEAERIFQTAANSNGIRKLTARVVFGECKFFTQ